MRPRYAPFYGLLLVLLTACATLGVETPKTLTERIAYVETTADGVVVSATNALNAHTISSKDARFVSDSAKQLKALTELSGSDPDATAAEGRLKLAEGILRQLQTYVASSNEEKK